MKKQRKTEQLKKHNICHFDLSYKNIMFKNNQCYLIDYGLCKRYIDYKLNSHIPYKEEKSLVGTVRYISIGNHMGIE